MKAWTTYRTRFLVKAKQLNTSLSFTDGLGRQHSGRKGDYLVESSDGILRIAPRQIFEDIYVPLADSVLPAGVSVADRHDEAASTRTARVLYEEFAEDELPQDELRRDEMPKDAHRQTQPFVNKPRLNVASRRPKTANEPLPPGLARKAPQPYRNGRSSSSGLGSI
jgi:hypothetical protein